MLKSDFFKNSSSKFKITADDIQSNASSPPSIKTIGFILPSDNLRKNISLLSNVLAITVFLNIPLFS